MMIVMTVSSILFGLFGSGDVQPWDDMEQFEQKEKEKERNGLTMNPKFSKAQLKSINDEKP